MKKHHNFKIALTIFFFSVFVNSKGQSFCRLIKNVDKNYDSIEANINSKNLFSDSCSLLLIDSLKGKFFSTSKYKYLDAIDKIALISDGYVSEVLDDAIEYLTINKTNELLSYLCSCKNNLKGGVEKFLLQILSQSRSDSELRIKITEWIKKKKAKGVCNRKCFERLENANKKSNK